MQGNCSFKHRTTASARSIPTEVHNHKSCFRHGHRPLLKSRCIPPSQASSRSSQSAQRLNQSLASTHAGHKTCPTHFAANPEQLVERTKTESLSVSCEQSLGAGDPICASSSLTWGIPEQLNRSAIKSFFDTTASTHLKKMCVVQLMLGQKDRAGEHSNRCCRQIKR